MKNNHDNGYEPFDFNDLDELIEKMFGNISSLPNLGDINPSTHHHSISFRFEKGMDKPEIRINGEKVDNETLNNLSKNMGIDFGIFPEEINLIPSESRPELDVKSINFPVDQSPDHVAMIYKDTYFEIDKNQDSALLTIELPGVERDHIVISQIENKVSVIGENDHTAYKVDFEIDFTLNKSKTEIEDINSIYQIKLNK